MNPCTAETASPAPTLAMTRSRVSAMRRSRASSRNGRIRRTISAMRSPSRSRKKSAKSITNRLPMVAATLASTAAELRRQEADHVLRGLDSEGSWDRRAAPAARARESRPRACARARASPSAGASAGSPRPAGSRSRASRQGSPAGRRSPRPPSTSSPAPRRSGPMRVSRRWCSGLESQRENRRPGEWSEERRDDAEREVRDQQHDAVEQHFSETVWVRAHHQRPPCSSPCGHVRPATQCSGMVEVGLASRARQPAEEWYAEFSAWSSFLLRCRSRAARIAETWIRPDPLARPL